MNKEEFIRKIYSKKYIDKQAAKIKLLGTRHKIDVYDLMFGRLFSSAVIFILVLYLFNIGYIVALFVYSYLQLDYYSS